MKKHEKKARSFAAMCCIFLTMIALCFSSSDLRSQIMTVTPTATNVCGSSRCCYHFKFEVSATTDYLEINPITNDGCWDWNCFLNQTFTVTSQGGPVTVTATHPAAGVIKLYFNAALTPSPAQVEFVLCPLGTGNCVSQVNQTYSWVSKNGGEYGTTNGSGNGSFNACPGQQTDCKPCDQTIIYWINDCSMNVCFKRRSTSGLSFPATVRFTFTPAFTACTPSGSCSSSITSSKGTTSVHTTGGQIDYIDVIFGPADNLIACEELCLTMPRCSTAGNPGQTVNAKVFGDPNNNCNNNPTGYFGKYASEETSEALLRTNNNIQSFPNPISKATDFNTTIPFEINAATEARIRIYGTNGTLVHEETESFSTAGKHFFYFTAKDLPAGQYFYMIEAPKGMTIVNKTLLVVK